MEHKSQETYHLNEKGEMVFETNQTIGEDYWQEMDAFQDDFQFRLNGLTPVASIPEAVVDSWIREGFDFWNAPAREIQKKLRMEEMTKMMVTQKTF